MDHYVYDKSELTVSARASPSTLREPTHSPPMRARRVQRAIDTHRLLVLMLSRSGAPRTPSTAYAESGQCDDAQLCERAIDAST